MLRDLIFSLQHNEHFILGFDLDDDYAQISLLLPGREEPETVPTVENTELFNIPAMIYKSGDRYFIGRDARREAFKDQDSAGGNPGLITNLLSGALEGRATHLPDGVDSVRLLGIFIRKVLSLVALDRIQGIMFTLDSIDGHVIDTITAALDFPELSDKEIYFQNHSESLFRFMIHQDENLWNRNVLVMEYRKDHIKTFSFECSRATTPAIVLISEKRYPIPTDHTGSLDVWFRGVISELTEGLILSSAYLLGESFRGDWMKSSLKLLCQKTRVFRGNNLFSRGACFGGCIKMSDRGDRDGFLFMGRDKLKVNVGVKAYRLDRQVFIPLLDAGCSWFEAQGEIELYLDKDAVFSLISKPISRVFEESETEIALEGMPQRPDGTNRIWLYVRMKSENVLELHVRDLGFGEFFPATDREWVEEVNLA